MAKYSGSYEDLNDTKQWDTAAEYFMLLEGAPFHTDYINGPRGEMTPWEIWEAIRAEEAENSMIVFDMDFLKRPSDPPKSEQDPGFVDIRPHSFSVLSTLSFQPQGPHTERIFLVKMYNPLG